MPKLRSHPATCPPEMYLDRALRRLVLAGVAVVVAVPAARETSLWFGVLPLWLLAMPLLSWWALHRFRLPHLRQPASPARRRRTAAQARRRPVTRPPGQWRHAA